MKYQKHFEKYEKKVYLDLRYLDWKNNKLIPQERKLFLNFQM